MGNIGSMFVSGLIEGESEKERGGGEMRGHNGLCLSGHLKNTSTQDLRGRKCVCNHSSSVKCCYEGVERQREKISERENRASNNNPEREHSDCSTEDTDRRVKYKVKAENQAQSRSRKKEKDFMLNGKWNKTWLTSGKEIRCGIMFLKHPSDTYFRALLFVTL